MAESPSENLDHSADATAGGRRRGAEPPDDVTGIDAELNRLPTYARSLLQIRVPVQRDAGVAAQEHPRDHRAGPGSIVKFDKTCDEPLELLRRRPADRPRAKSSKSATSSACEISGLVK